MSTIKPKPPRKKACKQCKVKFQPERQFQETCCIKCALELAKSKREKKAAKDEANVKRKERAKEREASKKKKEFYDNDRSHQTKLTQADVNKWVRFRDDGCNCISCNKPIGGGGYVGSGSKQAGHFKSAGGSPELRFNTLNIHLQCQRCNVQLSGNIAGYRPNLINKIGLGMVEWLEGPHEIKKYTCDQLRDIRAYYAKLTRDKNTDDSDCPHVERFQNV